MAQKVLFSAFEVHQMKRRWILVIASILPDYVASPVGRPSSALRLTVKVNFDNTIVFGVGCRIPYQAPKLGGKRREQVERCVPVISRMRYS
jgi:hypothetical protein